MRETTASRAISLTGLASISLMAILAIAGCSNIEKAKPAPQSVRADRSLKIDVPEVMRGTIASEAVVLGYESTDSPGYRPVIARGYGLVVGLNGTGSRQMAPQLRAYMLAQAAKYGFGRHGYGDVAESVTPDELLDSPNTAVVIVEAVIPQGAIKGTQFDVRVYADPISDTSSLEGGTLYTTDLRPGLPNAGGAQAAALAQAKGPIFINPFADPGAVGKDTIERRSGRILNGGVVIKDMPLKLRLANPNHTRAAILQSAINTRFPQESGHYLNDPDGQRDPTARGESDESIRITVPPSYRGRTDEFIELLRHTTIMQANAEAVAMSVRRTVLANPLVAEAASWRWQALGTRVLPLIKDLYDYPEEVPRMAALRAGSKLDDPMVISPLVQMAKSNSADARVQAIQLLSTMALNPQIDLALRKLLDDDDIEVRLESYEALVKRHDPYMRRYGVDGKFILDVVASDKPLIYITQIGQPRIVLFGPGLEIDRPATLVAWSGRFGIKGDLDDKLVEVYHRQPDAQKGVILWTEPNLEQFVQFLGHATTIEEPAPGLGLSYGETVGVLHEIWIHHYVKADFRAEQDRILAAILRQQKESIVTERPEFNEAANTNEITSEDKPAVIPASSDLGRLPGDRPINATGLDPTIPRKD